MTLAAAGGIGIIFVSAIPAMYRLHLLSEFPKSDVGKLIALTATAAFFGVFFVIPLRKYYIVHQKLTFPTPAATAYTIRALHNSRTGAIAARKKSLALLYSFIATFVYKVMTGYAPGIVSFVLNALYWISCFLTGFCAQLYDWHIGWTLYRLGFTSIISLDNYGWWIECEFRPARLLGFPYLSYDACQLPQRFSVPACLAVSTPVGASVRSFFSDTSQHSD